MKHLPLNVINFWAGPGAGKTTSATGTFNLMKHLGLRVELVTEYAKDLTYEGRNVALENQLLVLAKQDARLRRLVGSVDWVVTDSPLPLSLAYASDEYDGWLEATINGAFNRYGNYNFFVNRVKPYQRFGRSQSEHEALALDMTVRNLFNVYAGSAKDGDKAWHIDGDAQAPYAVVAKLPIDGDTMIRGLLNAGR